MGFVDSDDWIDHDMYQYLYTLMQEHDADVSACTYLLEQEGRPSKIINNTGKLYVFSRKEIIRALVKNDLVKNYLWAKLFKRKLFDRLSFPVGRVYEDVAVLYKVFYSSQKVVLSCVSKYHYMIHKNESITRGGYDPVKEYHYFLSLYEQDKFIQNAELGGESSVGVLKRGIHLINHTLLCPPSPAFEDIIDETMLKMREYRHITPWQLGPSMSIKRYFMCKHFGFYRMLYRGYRAIFKRKHKLLID
ncbi:MAG: glycosyl transferase family A [Bacteroides thetaiotaomicron]